SINCRTMLALVSIKHSITNFPAAFLTAIAMLSLCTSMPTYLVLVIKGCSFLERLSQALKTYSKSRLLRNEGDRRDESDVSSTGASLFCFGEANSRHRRWERDQLACRARCSLRPPRMFSMRFRL